MPFSPLTWTILALLVYACGTNLDWWLRGVATESRLATAWSSALAAPARRQALRLTYLLGMPLLALLLRVPSPAQIGLPSPPPAGTSVLDFGAWQAAGTRAWPVDVSLVIALSLATAGLIAAGHVWSMASQGRRARFELRRPILASLGTSALEALALEAHWALMRAGVVSIGLQNAGLTMGLALGLIGLCAWSNPSLRSRADDPDALVDSGQTAILGILSGLVFLETGSSLWALAGHLSVALATMSLLPAAWRDRSGPWVADSRDRSAPRRLATVATFEAEAPIPDAEPEPRRPIEPTVV